MIGLNLNLPDVGLEKVLQEKTGGRICLSTGFTLRDTTPLPVQATQ
jgi:hypothetical protein